MNKILIIDDENQIRRLLEITLHANGYQTIEAASGKEGCILAASQNPVMIILDLGLPDIDGTEVLRKLRSWYHQPIIILSVRNSEEDIIKALDAGANDYLTKPFRTGELLARLRACMRTRNQSDLSESIISFGDYAIDMEKHTLSKNNEIIKLTNTEFSLLALMAGNEGRVLTHTYILKELWGVGSQEQTQYLRVYIAQLRKKIENDPAKPVHIITESGIGYRFNKN